MEFYIDNYNDIVKQWRETQFNEFNLPQMKKIEQ